MHRGHPNPLTPPDHLVERPSRTGWHRLGVGTLPFNIVSFGILIAISSFIVRTPSTDDVKRISQVRAQQAAAAQARALKAEKSAKAKEAEMATTTTQPHIDAPMQVVTMAESAAQPVEDAGSTPTSPATPKRVTPRRTVTQPTTPPTQPKPKIVTCDSFATQPDAQAAFDADRTGLALLDGDGDGVACEQLPGHPTHPSAPQIPTVAQLIKPYTRLYGLHTPNTPYRPSEIADFVTAAGGKNPNTLLFFQDFTQQFPADAITASWDAGALPMVTWEPILTGQPKLGQPTLADIASGKWDEYIASWATAAAAQNKPFAMRFAQEMNGRWFRWSDGVNGNKTGDFIAAWRHIHDMFHTAGADNVIWVWSVNRIDALANKSLARVYPGDDFVDWVGISGYYRNAITGVAPSFNGTFAMTLNEVNKVAPSKLVMLTEVGAGTTVENRTAWIKSFFDGLLEHPEIIGFNWFNDFKEGDWRIQYAQATANAFAQGVADLRYGSLVYQAEPAPDSPALGAVVPEPKQPALPVPTTAPPLAGGFLATQALSIFRKRNRARKLTSGIVR